METVKNKQGAAGLSEKLQDYLSKITEKITEGKAVLFLGPKTSTVAGAPDSSQLVNEIKNKFPKIDQQLNGLLNVCEDFVETPEYKANDLISYVTNRLKDLQPTKAHLTLTKFPWPAIYTTNFDDLIEKAFLSRTDNERNSFVVSYPASAPATNRSKTYLFKIMGTISTRPENKMVLCRADYTKMLSKREEYLNNLEDFVMDGIVLFLGFNANDRLITDIIDTVNDKTGLRRLPESFVISQDDKLSDKDKYRLSSHKITVINETFEEFFEKFDNIPTKQITPHSEIIKKRKET